MEYYETSRQNVYVSEIQYVRDFGPIFVPLVINENAMTYSQTFTYCYHCDCGKNMYTNLNNGCYKLNFELYSV